MSTHDHDDDCATAAAICFGAGALTVLIGYALGWIAAALGWVF